MPKVLLNVEKLENKFQTLSRSRESIQGLSTWIMHHKEVHQEIVEQWLIGISKNYNTLAMFYVANEVIQGCGKKKCPEFREAFSKVLEEAASYEHVKEIKDKVFRLLNLWKERNIYDNAFSQRIENKLNSTEKEGSTEEETEEEELSEQEIIKKFNKQNLIDELEIMKSFEFKRKEKEDILDYADVPDFPNLEDVIVRLDCQDTLRKCDAYLTLVTDCTELIRNEISLRKKLLKELKNNCVFYTAQQKDVKEVANAFRIYGKRVKMMETRVAEKIATFPLPSNSPCFSEDMAVSPSTVVSCDTDDASKSTQSPINELNKSSCDASNSKEGLSFSGKVPTEAVSELLETVEQPSKEKSTNESIIPEFSKFNFSKITELIEETKSNNESVCDEQGSSLSEEAEKTLDKRITDIFHDQTNICGENLNDIPLKQADLTEEIKSFQAREIKQISDKESTRLSDEEVSSIDFEQKYENTLDKSSSILPIEQACNTEQKEQLESNPSKPQVKGNEDVDFLLEESFDKKSKTKLSYKRKIEFLLKSKGKKHCSNLHNQELSEKVSPKNDSPLLNSIEIEPKHGNKKDDIDKIYAQSKKIEKRQVEISKSVSKKVEDAKEIDSEYLETREIEVTKINAPEKNIGTTNILIESVSDNPMHCDESLNVNNTFIGSAVSSNDEIQPEKETFSFNPSGTFTGTALSSLMSINMSSEDPRQPEKETLPFNPSGTFTGTALSSLMSINMSSEDHRQPEKETLPFNPSGTFTGTALSSLMSINMSSEDHRQPEKETLPFNPSSSFTGTDMSSFISSMCSEDKKQLKNETVPFNPGGTFTGTALSSFMSTDMCSEDPKQPEKEVLPSDAFTGSALSSFMSGVSTDFLKNILQKNHQNTNTQIKTKDEPDQKALGVPSETGSKTPEQETPSNIPHNLKNIDTPNEASSGKDSVNSVDILQADSGEILKNSDTAVISENVKIETRPSLHKTHIELTQSLPDTTSKSVYSDKCAQEVEGTPSIHSYKQVVPSESLKLSNNNQVADKNPNLLETLQNVLECLSENIQARCDVKALADEERTELETPLPLESVLKIYEYLHGKDTQFINDNKSNHLQINSNTSNNNAISIVNASTENNYEVMDMECDSEDEMM